MVLSEHLCKKYVPNGFMILLYSFFLLTESGMSNSFANNYSDITGIKITLKALFNYKISESSGLVFTDGQLWTHNDKGGMNTIFNVDTSTGKIKQTVVVDNFPNIDWEDITADSNNIYVGDFGNNYGMRKNLKVLVIEKSAISDKPVVHVKARAIDFSYSEQNKFNWNNHNNFDCEAMLSIRDSLYLFSKDRGDNYTRVYRLSKTPGKYVLSSYTNYNVNGRICGASYDPGSNDLALVGYMPGTTHSFLWLMNGFEGTSFFSGTKKRIEISFNRLHWKTEGIAFENKDRVFISCETTDSQKAGLFVCEIDE